MELDHCSTCVWCTIKIRCPSTQQVCKSVPFLILIINMVTKLMSCRWPLQDLNKKMFCYRYPSPTFSFNRQTHITQSHQKQNTWMNTPKEGVQSFTKQNHWAGLNLPCSGSAQHIVSTSRLAWITRLSFKSLSSGLDQDMFDICDSTLDL